MDRIPTFALLIVRLDGWYQNRVWHGASMAARLLGVRLIALVGSAYGDPELRGGPTELYELAGSERIDGYLPVVGALGNFVGAEAVERLLEGLPPKPTVCIGVPLPGRTCVVPDGGGVELVVEHLVEVHGLKRIYFQGGPRLNQDSIRRKRDFVRAMEAHGLRPEPDEMPDGDFSPGTAYDAMAALFDGKGVPEAVVCANDAMAIGVRKLCRERGVRVPEDMLLTGYDDIEEASTMSPPLTTVDAATYQVAFRSVEVLHDLFKGNAVRDETVPTGIVVRRSCGCRSSASPSHLPRLLAEAAGVPDSGRIREILADPETAGPFLHRLEIAFEQVDHPELDLWEERLFAASRPGLPDPGMDGFLQAFSIVSRVRHGVDLNRRLALQVLLREQYSAVQNLLAGSGQGNLPRRIVDALQGMGAAHHLRILLFNEDCSPNPISDFGAGVFALEIDVAAGRIGAPGSDPLFPSGGLPTSNWITLSLSLADEHFGIIQVRDWNTNELFLESLRHSLSMVFSLARRDVLEDRMREELRKLSVRDELTGVLNRRGLLEQGELLVRAAVRGRAKIGVVLCDLDGLKEINDAYGHADGDLAIRCLARALEDGFRQSDVVGRLGGDEFAVVTLLAEDGGLDGAVGRVRDALAKRSAELARSWEARTSAGWMAWVPGDGETLEQAIIRADERLYQDKRRRKGDARS